MATGDDIVRIKLQPEATHMELTHVVSSFQAATRHALSGDAGRVDNARLGDAINAFVRASFDPYLRAPRTASPGPRWKNSPHHPGRIREVLFFVVGRAPRISYVDLNAPSAGPTSWGWRCLRRLTGVREDRCWRRHGDLGSGRRTRRGPRWLADRDRHWVTESRSVTETRPETGLELRIGVLVIGSLLRDSKHHRASWRRQRLDLDAAHLVRVPIRYGRRSTRRGCSYTMVFSSGLNGRRLGRATVVPCSNAANGIAGIVDEAERLWTAETSDGKNPKGSHLG